MYKLNLSSCSSRNTERDKVLSPKQTEPYLFYSLQRKTTYESVRFFAFLCTTTIHIVVWSKTRCPSPPGVQFDFGSQCWPLSVIFCVTRDLHIGNFEALWRLVELLVIKNHKICAIGFQKKKTFVCYSLLKQWNQNIMTKEFRERIRDILHLIKANSLQHFQWICTRGNHLM